MFKDLDIEPELLSASAVNQFIQYISSSRAVMFNGHLAQMLTLNNPDERIFQSGIERELGKYTFKKKLPANSRIVAVIPRYRQTLDNSISKTIEKIVIFENLETNEYDVIDIPFVSDYHQYFGFKYRQTKIARTMSRNDVLPKDTVLAEVSANTDNDGYAFGANANTVLMTHPEIAEDSIVISKSYAKKMGISIYERRTISFGSNKIPLNLYGDKDNYKPFPDIGDKVLPSGVIIALRENNTLLTPALSSIEDMMEYNPIFDECTYLKKGGGTVVDIKCNYAPKYRVLPNKGVTEQADMYADALKNFYKEIVTVCEDSDRDHYKKYGVNYSTTPALSRLLVEAYVYLQSVDKTEYRNVKKVYKSDPVDLYTLDIIVEHNIESLSLGMKITDLSGGKGVVCKIWDDDKMPITKEGVRADLISDSNATISRMNIGRLYDSYLSESSRVVKRIVTNIINNRGIHDESAVDEAWEYILDYLSIIDTEQVTAYANIIDYDSRAEIIKEIIEKEFYIYYPINANKSALELVNLIEKTSYKPTKETIFIPDRDTGELKETKAKMLISPFYMILLYKIADTWLATASSKVNHFGLPIGVSKKDRDRLPGKNAPVKIMSETEIRLYLSYTDELTVAELKDRANSMSTHKHLYQNILRADNPTNINYVVDRQQQPYGEDKALDIVNAIFNCAGIDIKYEGDKYKEYPPISE